MKKALRDERRNCAQMREELDNIKAGAAEERMASLKKMLLQGGGKGNNKGKARKRRRMRETWCPGRSGGRLVYRYFNDVRAFTAPEFRIQLYIASLIDQSAKNAHPWTTSYQFIQAFTNS